MLLPKACAGLQQLGQLRHGLSGICSGQHITCYPKDDGIMCEFEGIAPRAAGMTSSSSTPAMGGGIGGSLGPSSFPVVLSGMISTLLNDRSLARGALSSATVCSKSKHHKTVHTIIPLHGAPGRWRGRTVWFPLPHADQIVPTGTPKSPHAPAVVDSPSSTCGGGRGCQCERKET